jgi:hypothetical protein
MFDVLGTGSGGRRRLRFGAALAYAWMPRSWVWMQVAILVFVVAGMVIAITKLA